MCSPCDNKKPRNLCGSKIAQLRRQQKPALSQQALAAKLQLQGIDVDKMLFSELKRDNDS